MSELLKRENVAVDVEDEVVVFYCAGNPSRFSYDTAFDVAQRLRLAANVAARMAGVSKEERGDLKRQDAPEELFADVRLETGKLENGVAWNVWTEGELVAFQIGEVIAKWEAPAAMTIASWFREGGRQAKSNSGNRVKTLRIAGVLTDANLNAHNID